MQRFATLVLLALAPLFMGMNKKPKFTITIHAQADEMDVPKTMFPVEIGGRRILFKILPEISQENVVAFHPFDSESGNGKGVALQLEVRGRGNLEIATRTRRGEMLLAMVNGKPADYLTIDRSVTDGIITIWQGFTPEVIAEMDKKYQRIKASGAPSMSTDMEMIPSTRRERKKAKEAADRAAKEAEKARKAGKPEDEEVPSLPASPASPKLPVEGGSSLPPMSGAPPSTGNTPPPSLPGR